MSLANLTLHSFAECLPTVFAAITVAGTAHCFKLYFVASWKGPSQQHDSMASSTECDVEVTISSCYAHAQLELRSGAEYRLDRLAVSFGSQLHLCQDLLVGTSQHCWDDRKSGFVVKVVCHASRAYFSMTSM